jgi:hypothetical protein
VIRYRLADLAAAKAMNAPPEMLPAISLRKQAAQVIRVGFAAGVLGFVFAPVMFGGDRDAVSREISLYAGVLTPPPPTGAVSREFSLFAGNLAPVAMRDALSREFSILVDESSLLTTQEDALSREFSVLVAVPPVILFDSSPLVYREGDPDVGIAVNAVLENADSADFGGGYLRVEILTGFGPGDLLAIQEGGDGSLALEGEGIVSFNDMPIGTLEGGDNGNPLLVALNAYATAEAVRDLVRAITFANTVRFPTAGSRIVGLTLADALAGEGATATREVMVEPVNFDPVPGDDVIGVGRDTALAFDVSYLLENDADPDGDHPLLLAFPESSTAQGGTISIDGELISYSPPPGFVGVDRFAYTLSDAFGGVGTATVTVHVHALDFPSVTIREMVVTSEGVMLSLIVLPDTPYEAFWSEDLKHWEPLEVVVADAIGRLLILDADAKDFTARFYRFSFFDAPP